MESKWIGEDVAHEESHKSIATSVIGGEIKGWEVSSGEFSPFESIDI
jgi:hypothetical protein